MENSEFTVFYNFVNLFIKHLIRDSCFHRRGAAGTWRSADHGRDEHKAQDSNAEHRVLETGGWPLGSWGSPNTLRSVRTGRTCTAVGNLYLKVNHKCPSECNRGVIWSSDLETVQSWDSTISWISRYCLQNLWKLIPKRPSYQFSRKHFCKFEVLSSISLNM